MKKIKTIIVDDEELARQGLVMMLAQVPEVEVINTCNNGLEAIDVISDLIPDLVFLDIQMPGVNGFEVIASIAKPRPQIIFTTAHDEYALKAFEVNAIDYLLKPFTDERFQVALSKAIERIKLNRSQEKMDDLVESTVTVNSGNTKIITGLETEDSIVFKSEGKVFKVAYSAISHIEAFDYYIKIHVSGNFYLIRESMKKMEERLPNDLFVRIHKSYIVNVRVITQFGKSDEGGHEVKLVTGQKLKVSRNHKNQLLRHLG